MKLEYRGREIQIDEKYLWLLKSPRLLYYDAKSYLKFIKGKRNGGYRSKQIHRVIYELENRCLDFDEIVHHSNENILDIQLSNFTVLSRGEHTKIHRTGKFHSRDTKAKIREKRLGIHPTEETKRKIRASTKGKRKGENNSFFGRKHTKETKLKMSFAHKQRGAI